MRSSSHGRLEFWPAGATRTTTLAVALCDLLGIPAGVQLYGRAALRPPTVYCMLSGQTWLGRQRPSPQQARTLSGPHFDNAIWDSPSLGLHSATTSHVRTLWRDPRALESERGSCRGMRRPKGLTIQGTVSSMLASLAASRILCPPTQWLKWRRLSRGGGRISTTAPNMFGLTIRSVELHSRSISCT